MVRRIICFLMAGGMLGGGLCLLTMQFFFSSRIYFKLVIGAAILTIGGAYWLYEDFGKPLIRSQLQGKK